MIDVRMLLNLAGYIRGIIPSIIKINAKTIATVSKLVIS
jgi:hypothetical protein